jgi:hypothetical protein
MAGGNNGAAHSKLKNEILLALGRRSDVLVWNNPTGMFVPFGRENSPPVRCGIPGQADILAVVAPLGRLVGIECKTGSGRQSEAQTNWQKAMESRGGIYGVVRSVDDALTLVIRSKI